MLRKQIILPQPEVPAPTPDHADYVRRVVTEVFARVGVTPTIREK